MSRTCSFKVYRYQLLPMDRFQGTLFESDESKDDAIKNKNSILYKVLCTTSIEDSSILIKRRIVEEKDCILTHYAIKRQITIDTEEFKEKGVDTWPPFLLCFFNDETKQYLLIEENKKAYQNHSKLIKSITKNLNVRLMENNLSIYIEPLFEEKKFWEIAKKHEGKVTSLKFKLITPNLANISDTLDKELKEVAKNTNAVMTNLELTSSASTALKMDDMNSNPTISGLVSYASQGGGNISLKIRGIKKIIHTNDTVKTVTVDNIDIEGSTNNVGNLVRVLSEALK